MANPLSAFLEWYRVLRSNGVIYMVVRSRLFTFDRLRPLTAVEHIVEDFRNHVTQCDGTHIDDFVLNVDWREFLPDTPEAGVPTEREKLLKSYTNAIQSGSEINIHFHTFEPGTMQELIRRANAVMPANGGSIRIEGGGGSISKIPTERISGRRMSA